MRCALAQLDAILSKTWASGKLTDEKLVSPEKLTPNQYHVVMPLAFHPYLDRKWNSYAINSTQRMFYKK